MTAWLWILFWIGARISAAHERPLTLPESVRFGLEHAPSVNTALLTKDLRAAESHTAVAKLLPSLDLTTTHEATGSRTFGPTTSANGWQNTLGLSLSENLYDNGQTLTGIRIARLNERVAELSYLQARDRLILDIAAQFYRVSLFRVLHEARQQQYAAVEKQFEILSRQYRQGLKSKVDYIRLKSQLHRSQEDSITSAHDLDQATTELLRRIGDEGSSATQFAALSPDPKLKPSVPTGSPPVENTYEHRIAALQRDVNARSVDLATREYWPRVSISAVANYLDPRLQLRASSFGEGTSLDWSAGITINFNLLDWGIRRRAVEVAELNRRVGDLQQDQSVLDTGAQISVVMSSLSQLSANLALDSELVSAEEESYRYLQSDYQAGRVKYLDLITGLNDLLDAKVRYYTSYYGWLESVARYHYFNGTLHDKIFSS